VNRLSRRSLALAAATLFPWLTPAATAAPVNPFAEGVRPTEKLSPEQELKSFHLPPGFSIQLVAAEPDVHKPINLAIDAKGRLWVTSTVEYPWPVKDPNVKPRDEVKVLEIDAASGRATKVTTFADGLNIPAGVYPYKDGCIAFSIPNIWRLQDTDGDGVADKRDVLYGPFDTSRDTHGMNNSFTRGYDGLLYATHGFNNQSRITAKDGSKLAMDSGNIYRMTLDGQHVDHIAHGPVNPFGLMFDSAGTLWLADCHTKPIQVVLRGAWFEHFGRPHDGIGFYPKIMGHLHGSTAIGGVVVVDDDRWPAEFRGNLLCGNPMTSRVDRDSVTWSGSTPALTEKPDFVASDDPWFRPVAFAFAPDGSIYLADFYNRIIGHYEVPLTHPGRDRTSGRIWRIVPPMDLNGAPASPGDLSKASVEDLIRNLDHANVSARMLATDQLTDRIGKDAIAPAREIFNKGTPRQKVHALWTLFRLGDVKPEEIAAAAKDGDKLVRTHAVRMLSELRDLTTDQRQVLLAALKDADPLVRRNAADALGQHPMAEGVAPLVDLLRSTDKGDTHLAYVARIALRGHLSIPMIMASFTPDNFPGAADGAINDVLPAVKTPEAAALTIRQLAAGPLKSGNVGELLKHAANFGGDAGVTAGVEYAKAHVPANNIDAQLESLKSIQGGVAERGGRIAGPTRAWAADVLARALAGGAAKSQQRLQAVADLATALKLKEAAPALAAIVNDPKADSNIRVVAIKSVLALDAKNAPAVAGLVADARQPAALREAAAKALSDVNTDEARQSLLKPIGTAPHALATKLAVALAGRPEGAATLMEAFERNTLTPRLLLEPTVKDKLAAAKIKDLDAKVANLTKTLAPASAQLDELIAAKRKAFDARKADVEKGKAVFAKSCAICHQIDGQGAVVGPQLDGIGSRGLDRILEDVIDPNRNVDPNFRYSNVTLNDGDVVSGLVRGEAGQTILLVDATGKENPIPKSDVKSVDVSKLSLMPTGFGEIIAPDDFNNLLAYLLSRSTAKQP
jgi:putative heme-binding domain-containing protein